MTSLPLSPTARAHALALGCATLLTCLGWLSYGRPAAEHLQFGADQALLVQSALEVQQGQPPLTGAYSKSGVSHPGPSYEWILAGVLLARGNDVLHASAAMGLLQWATAGLLVLTVYTITRSPLIAAVVVVAGFYNPTFGIYARLIWNPSIVFPAAAASLLLALHVGAGRLWLLPLLGVTTSLMMQAHAAAAPVAMAILLTGVVWTLAARHPAGRRWMCALVAALAVMWLPPAVDAWRHDGGNLAAIAALGAHGSDWHPWREVGNVLHGLLAECAIDSRVALVMAGMSLVCVLTMDGHLRRGAMLWATAMGTFSLSVAAVPGTIETYYLRYAFVLVPLTLGIGWSGARELLPGAARQRMVDLVAICAVGLMLWQAQPWKTMREVLAAPPVTLYPLADTGRAAALMRAGHTSRREVRPQTRVAAGGIPPPCPFSSAPEVSFAVGRAVAVLLNCDAERPRSGAPYHLGAPGATDTPQRRRIYEGRAFSLFVQE